MLNASSQQWNSFVIVSHSFELIKGRRGKSSTQGVLPNYTVIRRFERLCQSLRTIRIGFKPRSFKVLTRSRVRREAPCRQYTQTCFARPIGW